MLKVPRPQNPSGVRRPESGRIRFIRDYGRNYGAIYDVEAATDMLVEWGGDGWNYTDNYMTGRYQRRRKPTVTPDFFRSG